QLGRNAPLAALYAVLGDEPLLVTETLDALRSAARAAGYTERTTLVMDARSDWSQALAATRTVSRFADRRVLELELPPGKPGKTGADTLIQLAEQSGAQSDPDTIVVLALPRPDRATRDARWMQALARHGVTVDVPTIERERLPAWIGQRLARQNQQVDAAA